jgi:hypothetical protein
MTVWRIKLNSQRSEEGEGAAATGARCWRQPSWSTKCMIQALGCARR